MPLPQFAHVHRGSFSTPGDGGGIIKMMLSIIFIVMDFGIG